MTTLDAAFDSCGAFPIVEFRRYSVKPGEREHFAEYFETFFPEAFQQEGVVIFGSFLERGNPEKFTWLRGFHDNFHRGRANSAFYYGPVWQEHRARMNDRLDDSDNVLQLTSVASGLGLPVLPAVDPVRETGSSRGVVVAVAFPIRPGAVDQFLETSGPIFRGFRESGIRELAVMKSLEVSNPFPQLPVRDDGPFVLWLGIAESARPFETDAGRAMVPAHLPPDGEGPLRGAPELVLLDPTRRSRLRWRPEFGPAQEAGA
ncbi:MAG: hypothetical protein ACREBT_02645 [Thermoplasmata archaeon]